MTDSPVTWHHSNISREQRWAATSLDGATVWLTGLSGSGKSSIAVELEKLLNEQGRGSYLLDGDNLRHGLNSDLGFSLTDRDENVRRVAHVASLFADSGFVAIVPIVSPLLVSREAARGLHVTAKLPFFEVFVDTPLEVCEERDPKGLYSKARSGAITNMTGIDSPYEPPQNPALHVHPDDGDAIWVANKILTDLLEARPGASSF